MDTRNISDTIHVPWQGGVIVDLQKLLAKSHIRKLMSDINGKVRIASKPLESAPDNKNP